MKQKTSIFIDFLKDKLSLLALYFSNSAIIILFFNLSQNSHEWLYPVLLSIVIFLPYLIVQWFSYRKLMLMINHSETNIPDEVYTNSRYIKRVNGALIKIHKHYNCKLNDELKKNIEFRRIISQFIHAMKTPVTVIDLAIQRYDDNLYQTGEEEIFHKSLSDIKKENNRLSEMLNNLLEYLRLEEFSKDYTPVSVNLSSELTQIINNKKRSFIYSNVRPDITVNQGEAAEVLTDIKWNRIMIDQIISNAIKYSDASDEMKSINFNIECQKGKTILTISDKGIGIPRHDIPKIMDAFFTGENGRKRDSATGIGLYIVKLISENLGHDILIESQAGVGTKVKIVYYKTQNTYLSKV